MNFRFSFLVLNVNMNSEEILNIVVLWRERIVFYISVFIDDIFVIDGLIE